MTRTYRTTAATLIPGKDYAGLWAIDRSFTPIIAQQVYHVTFDVFEDTGSNLTSNVSVIATLARASLKTHLAGCPGIET